MLRPGWAQLATGIVLALLLAAGSWLFHWWRIEAPALIRIPPPILSVQIDGRVEIHYPAAVFAATVATFRDELFAFLMYQHYRSLSEYAADDLVLHRLNGVGDSQYRILLVLSDELMDSLERSAKRFAAKEIESFNWELVPLGDMKQYRKQSQIFVTAYNLPVTRKMEDLSNAELTALLRRFIRFKSTIDPRVRRRIEDAPNILKISEAQRLAGDIIAVADFYQLPLEFLLGIGAMENNYMNVRGDLKHTIWKRKLSKDDIVVERRNGRFRVLNDSAGVWQITRETLRGAHKLYLGDRRDYSRLPDYLRPKKELDVNDVDPRLLTTYAGILLRDLIDRFDGNMGLAIGAYNGGPGNPNLRYYQGVQAAADHARQVLEQAAALNGRSVLEIPWWTSR